MNAQEVFIFEVEMKKEIIRIDLDMNNTIKIIRRKFGWNIYGLAKDIE